MRKGNDARLQEQALRRGIAMLLVLISLMMATILTVAYVASRDNSAAIGQNVAGSAAARWAADSGLDLGLAILQTESGWRANPQGRVLTDFGFAGGTINIEATDLQTSQPPTDKTEHIQIKCIGSVNGVEQTCIAYASVPAAVNDGLDLDLSEFAVFAKDRITMTNDATVARWPQAPLSVLGRPVALGTQSTSAGALTISNTAAVIDGQVFAPLGASDSLIWSDTDRAVELMTLQGVIPMPGVPGPGVANPAVPSAAPVFNAVGGTGTISASTRWSSMSMGSGAKRTLTGDITLVCDGDMQMMGGASLKVNGRVKLVIFGGCKIESSIIELGPTGKLTMFVGNGMTVRNAYVGNALNGRAIDSTGEAQAMNCEALRIYRAPSGAGTVEWTIDGHSALKGTLYALGVRVVMANQSAIYGRVAAQEVIMRDQAAVFYDPALRTRQGYTDPDSPIFGGAGHIQDSILAMASLDSTSLQQVADALGSRVRNPDASDTWVAPANDTSDNTPPAVPADEPTPRTVPVTFRLLACGSDARTWEQ